MTYLVSDKDMSELNRGLTSLTGLADDLKIGGGKTEAKVLIAIICGLRARIAQWAKLRPVVDELGHETEIINSSIIAECAIHGLFFLEDMEKPVRDRDCPACAKKEEDKEQAAREAWVDAKVEEIHEEIAFRAGEERTYGGPA